MSMNVYQIQNEQLSITINSKGAELSSVFSKLSGFEYMWDADAQYWSKSSPILFPIVGGLKDNTFVYKGKEYILSRHGFARDMEFVVLEKTATGITFQLQSNDETLLLYPFHFVLRINYELRDNKVFVTYLVTNKGKENMYFSIGAHPAFNVPLDDGTFFEDYYLLFNHHETVERLHLNKDGLISSHSTPFFKNENRLKLKHEIFKDDAIILSNLHSTQISLLCNNSANGLHFSFHNFPYMGLWQPANAPFLCIEPWCGIADFEDTTQDITQKKGIEKLPCGDTFVRSWDIEIL